MQDGRSHILSPSYLQYVLPFRACFPEQHGDIQRRTQSQTQLVFYCVLWTMTYEHWVNVDNVLLYLDICSVPPCLHENKIPPRSLISVIILFTDKNTEPSILINRQRYSAVVKLVQAKICPKHWRNSRNLSLVLKDQNLQKGLAPVRG